MMIIVYKQLLVVLWPKWPSCTCWKLNQTFANISPLETSQDCPVLQARKGWRETEDLHHALQYHSTTLHTSPYHTLPCYAKAKCGRETLTGRESKKGPTETEGLRGWRPLVPRLISAQVVTNIVFLQFPGDSELFEYIFIKPSGSSVRIMWMAARFCIWIMFLNCDWCKTACPVILWILIWNHAWL